MSREVATLRNLFQDVNGSLLDEGSVDSFEMARKMAVATLLFGAAGRLLVETEPCRSAASLTRVASASGIALVRVHFLAPNKVGPTKALSGVFCPRQRHTKLTTTTHATARGDGLAPPLWGRS